MPLSQMNKQLELRRDLSKVCQTLAADLVKVNALSDMLTAREQLQLLISQLDDAKEDLQALLEDD